MPLAGLRTLSNRKFIQKNKKHKKRDRKRDLVKNMLNIYFLLDGLNYLGVDATPPGYPRLSVLIASDENFTLYRRFSFLQARTLLNKQDQLRELENDLDKLDRRDNRDGIRGRNVLASREVAEASSDERKNELAEAERRVIEYGKCLKPKVF